MSRSSLLWEFSKTGKPNSYLFGTMHVKDEIAYSHLEKALKALSNCTIFKTEIDLEEAKKEIKPTDYLMPEDIQLTDLLSTKQFRKLRSLISKCFDVDLMNWNRFYPLMTLNFISESILSEDHRFALDQYLWTKAIERKMATGGIETVQSQVETLKSLDVGLQLRMFRNALKNVQSFRSSVFKIVSYYESEDIIRIYKSTRKSLGSMR